MNNMSKKNNLLLVDLNNPKTKNIAETITSDTSRKILDYLAEVDNASESKIAKELSLAISTVHYHLQKLQESELIDISGFTYSKKGRKINHYALANKYIIITPKKMSGLKSKLKKILPIAAVPFGLGVVLKFYETFKHLSLTSTQVNYQSVNPTQEAIATESAIIQESAETHEKVRAGSESYGSNSAEATSNQDITLFEPSIENGNELLASFFGIQEIAHALILLSILIIIIYFAWNYWRN